MVTFTKTRNPGGSSAGFAVSLLLGQGGGGVEGGGGEKKTATMRTEDVPSQKLHHS